MSISESYNSWAAQYDNNHNRTRDLEKKAIRDCLQNISFTTCLEIGCGTGKNTEWLAAKGSVTAVDFSEEMLQKAKEKNITGVTFIQADVTKAWDFTNELYDLVSFSLVLEHVEDLDHIFIQATECLNDGGYIYLGELHPFKQYAGSKARFDTEAGRHELTTFNHHVSHFIKAAQKKGMTVITLEEYFDNDLSNEPPRILSILFQKRNLPSTPFLNLPL
ncbi:MAG TPA: methyltransferase domain-containing protein [Chitinophagaceae bacterium]|nr:methyltransferase domain-containing protein [Chitinophagaceae bacterium]